MAAADSLSSSLLGAGQADLLQGLLGSRGDFRIDFGEHDDENSGQSERVIDKALYFCILFHLKALERSSPKDE